jgi:hypothetical protein
VVPLPVEVEPVDVAPVAVEVAAVCVPVVVPPAPLPLKPHTPTAEHAWRAGQAWQSAPSTPQVSLALALHTPATSQQPVQLLESHLLPQPVPSPSSRPTRGSTSQFSRVFIVVSGLGAAARRGFGRTIA